MSISSFSSSFRSFDSEAEIDQGTSLSLLAHHDGVQVEFADFGDVFHQARDAEQDILDGGDIGGGLAAISLEQPAASDSIDHLCRVAVGQRGNSENDIF